MFKKITKTKNELKIWFFNSKCKSWKSWNCAILKDKKFD